MNNIEFIEICPRDGFQNVKEFIPTNLKKEIVDKLVTCGFKKIQVTSFISPKAIEQMKDASEVAEYALQKYPDISFFALVPNLKGMERAYSAGIREITYVISVSETHNKANVNRSHEESFADLETLIKNYKDVKINLDVATAFGCPFEGETSLENLLKFIKRAYDLGIRTFDICDTIGIAYPKQIQSYLSEIKSQFPDCKLGIHIHDTRNMGVINTYLAMELGVDRVFTVCSGLGGCPFAPGASGNTSSEDFLYMLDKNSVSTGINIPYLIETAKFIKQNVPTGNFSGHQINIE